MKSDEGGEGKVWMSRVSAMRGCMWSSEGGVRERRWHVLLEREREREREIERERKRERE